MTTPNQFEPVRYELIAENPVPVTVAEPFQLLRRKLRGRYALVIKLSVALALIGAAAGFFAVSPKYRSTGLVRVQATLPTILYSSEDKALPPNFDAYVAAQATFMQSRTVLENAVTQQELMTAGWPVGAGGVARLEGSLSVDRRRGEQVITVSVVDETPELAQAATNAVLASFEASLEGPETTAAIRERALREREASLESDLALARAELFAASSNYGPDAIDRIHNTKVMELISIEQTLAQIATALQARQMQATQPMPSEVEVVTVDDPMLRLREELQLRQSEMDEHMETYGHRHPIVRDLARQIDLLNVRIELREQALSAVTATAPSSDTLANTIATASADRLAKLQERYLGDYDRIREDATALGQQRATIAGVQERITETRDLLQQTRRRLDELDIEGQQETGHRVSVATWGSLPVTPEADRRVGLAAVGGLFGMILGVGIVFVMGLVDPRCRYLDEIIEAEHPYPVIGCLPDVGPKSTRNKDEAALAVHQLRNYLELQTSPGQSTVVAVTSADDGEGKTSLAMALAISLADAGRKTLVIDGDLARAGLTKELGLRNQTGFWQAIGPASAGGEIHPTRRFNLWAMPVGRADGARSNDLSIDKLRWLIDAVREQFDSIVIDCGSVLSSVEAVLLTAVADRSLVVVKRRQNAKHVQTATNRLERVGATGIGLVFNQASEADLVQESRFLRQRKASSAAFVGAAPTVLRDAEADAPSVAATIGQDDTTERKLAS